MTLLGINLHNPIWLLLQSTSIDWLKPVLTTGSFNTSIDRFFANPGLFGTKEKSLSDN